MRIEVNVLDYVTGEVSIIYGMWRWEVETSSFPLKISEWDKEKLQDSW